MCQYLFPILAYLKIITIVSFLHHSKDHTIMQETRIKSMNNAYRIYLERLEIINLHLNRKHKNWA